VVEPPASAADDHDVVGASCCRRVDGQLEVGLVLGDRVLLDGDAPPARGVERLLGHRVEVAQDEVDGEPESVGVVETRVGRDHPGA
jgi:hypothetical protein